MWLVKIHMNFVKNYHTEKEIISKVKYKFTPISMRLKIHYILKSLQSNNIKKLLRIFKQLQVVYQFHHMVQWVIKILKIIIEC